MAKIQTFEDLDAWQACRALRNFAIKDVLPLLPDKETYSLIKQIRDAARSTTNNIAEGFGRFHYRDNYKFCSIARGSLYEVLDHLIDAHDEALIDDALLKEGRKLVEQAAKKLNGYMSYLDRADSNTSRTNEPIADYGVAQDLSAVPKQPVTNNQ